MALAGLFRYLLATLRLGCGNYAMPFKRFVFRLLCSDHSATNRVLGSCFASLFALLLYAARLKHRKAMLCPALRSVSGSLSPCFCCCHSVVADARCFRTEVCSSLLVYTSGLVTVRFSASSYYVPRVILFSRMSPFLLVSHASGSL